MSKKRRTKKEKLAASTRHTALDFQLSSVISNSQPTQNSDANNIKPSPISYSYVIPDTKKTFFITTVLLLLNAVLYFILKLGIVNIPGMKF